MIQEDTTTNTFPNNNKHNNTKSIEVEKVALPKNCIKDQETPPLAYFFPHILTQQECRSILDHANNTETGFYYVKQARHVAPDGSEYMIDLMKPNTHKLSLIVNNDGLVKLLWNRIRDALFASESHVLPKEFLEKYGMPLGINPRLRVLKYDSVDNDLFDPHFDVTTFFNDNKEQSILTVLLYLNDDFVGGETNFLDYVASKTFQSQEGLTTVTPKEGSILLFHHDLYHSGAQLSHGTKYILRTDVLFRAQHCQQNPEGVEKGVALLRNITICDNKAFTVKQLMNKAQYNKDEQLDKLEQALSQLDLLEGSLESFCMPGKELLSIMINDVIRDQLCCETIETFINQAFASLTQT